MTATGIAIITNEITAPTKHALIGFKVRLLMFHLLREMLILPSRESRILRPDTTEPAHRLVREGQS
jgi:hypothetical protein